MTSFGYMGPYELRGELGRGAMARVWRAWDPKLEREVAIKEPLFDPRLSDTIASEMGRRFVAEARAAARLSHPGIVTIYAADVFDGRPAIVMELIDGETLSARLARGPLSGLETLTVLDQLLDATGYAHERGVVHRDIKPDNIFITTQGQVKLADFGVAHVEGSGATVGTMVGTVLGTPGYMSPEQATGAPVDARSDLFSVGVVAYKMLTGRNPFGADDGADTTTLLYRIVHEPVPELPASAMADVPNDLRPAIMAALAKDPADRPQSALEFREMLLGRRTALRPLVTASDDPVSPKRTSYLPYLLIAAVAVVVLGFLLVSALGGRGSAGSTASSVTAAPATGAPAGSDQTGDDTTTDIPAETTAGAPAEGSAQDGTGDGAQEQSGQPDIGSGVEGEPAASDAAAEAPASSEYILPESDSRYYSRDELEQLDDWHLWMARNELYARHGRMFKNEEAQAYFDSKSWYEGLYTPREYDKKGVPKVYNDYEASNRALIQKIERERNSPYAE